jgi:hypothetical protein
MKDSKKISHIFYGRVTICNISYFPLQTMYSSLMYYRNNMDIFAMLKTNKMIVT